MKQHPIRTTVIGSYPFPSWLEYSSQHLDAFGSAEIAEMQDDAVIAAIHDQVTAGLDVITDGEQTRFDFNLSFYGYLNGIEQSAEITRNWGPPAHDQRGKHKITGEITAPLGLGVVEEYKRLAKDLIAEGCDEITLDEPSMSCYAYKEDTKRFVDIFNRTVEPIVNKCRLSTHLCFGNYKGHPVGYRKLKPMFPDFLDFKVDEIHVEMANREFSEIEMISIIAEKKHVAVGIIDVKSYYIETVNDVVERIDKCLEYVHPDRLSVAPDCGLSQTARWAARQKLNNMVEGAQEVRKRI
jgi:5-methyltetrahydropteroyltriglutamate--homocysteine methyltransferase